MFALVPDASAPPDGVGPKVFFEKEVLRAGTWYVAGCAWPVSVAILRRLAENFRRARRNGIRIPVVWNHSHDARDQLGVVTDLFVRGRRLAARFWVAHPQAAAQLEQVATEVSAEICRPWLDGQGGRYDLMLTHLGVVLLPVVAGQTPLVRLALADSARGNAAKPHGETLQRLFFSTKGGLSMDNSAEEPAVKTAAETTAALVGTINALFATLTPLPPPVAAGASLEEVITHLQEVVAARKAEPTSEPAGEPSLPPLLAPADEVAMLRLQLATVQADLAAEQQQRQGERRHQFTTEVDRLIAEGRLVPADRPALLAAAEPAQFTLSLLRPFQRIPVGTALPTRGIARQWAVAEEPELADSRPAMTAERAEAIAQSFQRFA